MINISNKNFNIRNVTDKKYSENFIGNEWTILKSNINSILDSNSKIDKEMKNKAERAQDSRFFINTVYN